ncbi:MAG: hypothetical protein ABI806_06020 [Candidatus Solibacter sp.]
MALRRDKWDTVGEGALTMKCLRIFSLMAVFALLAFADATGTWKASIETPNGAMENTFTLKVEADKLSGTVTMGQMGEAPISEGKVDGDNVAFAVVRDFNGNQFRINYKGKVAGDEMKLTGEVVGMDRTFEMTAKRSK